MAEEDSATAPVFKKRAKSTFKRKHESSEAEDEAAPPQLSVAEILRQRKQGKIRRSTRVASQEREVSTPAVSSATRQESDVGRMQNRFVPQTGQVVSVYDKQM
jgi:hypothetical protein